MGNAEFAHRDTESTEKIQINFSSSVTSVSLCELKNEN